MRAALLLIVGVLLGGWSAFSWASTVTALDYWVAGSSGAQPTYAAACQAVMASGDTYYGVTACGGSYPNRSCHCAKAVTGGGADTGIIVSEYVYCPLGTLDSSHGTPFQCVIVDCVSKKGTVAASGGSWEDVNGSGWCASVAAAGAVICSGGCSASADFFGSGGPGSIACSATDFVYTGTECTGGPGGPDATNSQPPGSGPCEKGTCPGTVNGVSVCLPCSSTTSKNSSSNTTSNSDNSSTTTSTTSTTSCTGDKCTTTTAKTTTTKDAQGNTTGTANTGDNRTESKQTFCESNPTNPACKDSSAGGGQDCTSPPTCSGDAIQCAILNQEWHTRCDPENEAAADPYHQLGKQIIDGNDPMKGSLPDPSNPSVVPVGQLNQTETFVAACPAPITATVYGKTIAFDLTPLCTLGTYLGYLNVMLALIGAANIVGGSFKGA